MLLSSVVDPATKFRIKINQTNQRWLVMSVAQTVEYSRATTKKGVETLDLRLV